MANLTRYDPLILARFDPFGDANDLFNNLLVRPGIHENVPEMQIRLALEEGDAAYTVHADIPGVKKEDSRVGIDSNQVSISANPRWKKKRRQTKKTLCSERYCGNAVRSFTLALDVDETMANAIYSDGLLKLTVPKKRGIIQKTGSPLDVRNSWDRGAYTRHDCWAYEPIASSHDPCCKSLSRDFSGRSGLLYPVLDRPAQHVA